MRLDEKLYDKNINQPQDESEYRKERIQTQYDKNCSLPARKKSRN